MRHRRKFNHLSRKSAHRKAMLANMATSLILHKRIHTTLAKAKALRTYIEPLITRSKEDTTHSRRMVFSYLQSKEAVTELFREISTKVAERPGGYTRIIKLPNRLGDNAEMCMMELVDYNENLLAEKEAKQKSSRRRRSSGKKKTEDQVGAETAVAEEIVEETAEVVDEVVVTEAEEKTEEVAEDLIAEAKVEEKPEEKTAEPVEDKKEEPKEEVKKPEEPTAGVKEETKAEDKKEDEVKDEKAKEEKKEEEKDSDKKKKDDTK